MTLLRTPPGTDPYLHELVAQLQSELLRKECHFIGWRHDSLNLHLRFSAPIQTHWVRVHVQSTEPGMGGSAYNPAAFVSSVEVDCRDDRVQDLTLPDLVYGRYTVYLIPIERDALGTVVLYNGVGGVPDHMSFIDVGV